MGCCGTFNFNCLLKPLITILNIFYTNFKTIVNSSFFYQQVVIKIRNHQGTINFKKTTKTITNPNLKFQKKTIAKN